MDLLAEGCGGMRQAQAFIAAIRPPAITPKTFFLKKIVQEICQLSTSRTRNLSHVYILICSNIPRPSYERMLYFHIHHHIECLIWSPHIFPLLGLERLIQRALVKSYHLCIS
jgi:hypothetical protein